MMALRNVLNSIFKTACFCESYVADHRPLSEKEVAFRQAMAKYQGFADFAVGEHYLKNGNQEQAFEAFRRSYTAVERAADSAPSQADKWLIMQVRARCRELASTTDALK
jgi:hypothetical protein